jgi:hypothetical protein
MKLKSCITCSLIYNNPDVSIGVIFFFEMARVEVMILDFLFFIYFLIEAWNSRTIGQWPLLKMYELIVALVFFPVMHIMRLGKQSKP